tara:strand:+ start:9580 stop:11298 length:1719 start_codon:yes stop_codon:yes gene_type:complete
MYYNKYLLFYPDGYGDGGDSGDIGGGDGEVNPDDEGGSSVISDPLYSETVLDINSNIKKSTTTTTGKKYIKSLKVQDSETLINARGDSRDIRVIGTPGSGFNLEVNDSSGCSILEESLNQVEIPKNGVYTLKQSFPDISTSAQGGLVKEHYDIILTPNADATHNTSIDINENSTEEEITRVLEEIKNNPAPDYKIGKPSVTLHQYPDVTITVTNSSSQTGPALSVSGSNITKTNRANSEGIETVPYTLVITEDSTTAGYFYVNNGSFNKSLTTNTMLKKVISRPEGEFSKIGDLVLKPSTTRTDANGNITGDLTAGMKIYGKIEKTKIVTESLEVPTCKRKTDKFSLSDTVGLFPGMTINIPGETLVELVSVDCAKNITIDRKVAIQENREIIFKYETWSSVKEIRNQINSRGETEITTATPIHAVNGMELEFDDDTSQLDGTFRFSGSGSKTVTLVSNIDISKFGLHDITYTWNLDDFITRKPNAYDRAVDVPKNTTTFDVKLSRGDYDVNISSKTPTITKQPSHGAADTSDGLIITYVPDNGYVGDDEILYTIRDGTTTSEEKRITITVK